MECALIGTVEHTNCEVPPMAKDDSILVEVV
jgi:hypothetical protein